MFKKVDKNPEYGLVKNIIAQAVGKLSQKITYCMGIRTTGIAAAAVGWKW